MLGSPKITTWNTAGRPVGAIGMIGGNIDTSNIEWFDGTSWQIIDVESICSKSITVEEPTSSEDITIFYTIEAITITSIQAVLVGSSTPSVTWTIRHQPDRDNLGNEVVTGGTTTTSTTTADAITSFNDATIPANSFIWLETTAQSGTVDQLNITLNY